MQEEKHFGRTLARLPRQPQLPDPPWEDDARKKRKQRKTFASWNREKETQRKYTLSQPNERKVSALGIAIVVVVDGIRDMAAAASPFSCTQGYAIIIRISISIQCAACEASRVANRKASQAKERKHEEAAGSASAAHSQM